MSEIRTDPNNSAIFRTIDLKFSPKIPEKFFFEKISTKFLGKKSRILFLEMQKMQKEKKRKKRKNAKNANTGAWTPLLHLFINKF